MGGSINRFRGRRLAAVLGAVTLSLAGVAGTATTASAADDYGNIKPDKQGSILIHKHAYQSTTTVTATPDGTTNIPSAAVSGVTFTAYKITAIDLTVAAGWTATTTAALTVATACDSLPTAPSGTTSAGSATTGIDGQASISSLAIGAYIVCETAAPATVVDKAQPFIVTIPFSYKRATGTAESWLYDVDVYPKNGVANITKTVNAPTALGLGAIATYPVTTDIPTTANLTASTPNEVFTHYWVKDPMDARLIGVAVASVTVDGSPVTSSYYTVTPVGNVLTVRFTTDGLDWLKGKGGKQLVTTFTGTVASLGTGATAGIFTNTASFSAATEPGTAAGTPDDAGATSASISATATQNWGDLVIHKVDAGDSTTGLVGAVFEVYNSSDPNLATCSSITPAGDAISVNGAATFTTGTNGLVTIPGLFVSDSTNAPTSGTQRCYVLKEITPPVGFILPVVTPFTAVTVKTGATATTNGYNPAITNTRIQGVVLPMTGSNGIVVRSVAGLALIAAGLVLAFLARRRTQTA